MSALPLWTHVLVHHSGTSDTGRADTAAHRRHHVQTRGWKDLGYHFVVERIGETWEVLVGRPLDMPGAHCPGMNRRAIGVCFVGDFTASAPPEEQLEVGARFLRGLCRQFRIPSDHIQAHRDYRSTECPGAWFPMEQLRRRCRALIQEAGNDLA